MTDTTTTPVRREEFDPMEEVAEIPILDANLHGRNRSRFTPDELRPYAGQWLAWNREGDRIVAHHPDILEMCRLLTEHGLATEEVVIEQLPPTDRFEELL